MVETTADGDTRAWRMNFVKATMMSQTERWLREWFSNACVVHVFLDIYLRAFAR